MDKNQALQILAILTAAFPSTQIKKATAEIYIEFLIVMDFNLTRAAAHRLITTAKFFPTIAEITEAVEKFNPQLPGADQAWLEVMEQIRKTGYFGIPQFMTPCIMDAVKTIGWTNLCTSEQIGVERAHFMKIYDAIKGRHTDNKINTQVLQLAGNIGLLGDEKC